MKKYAFFILSLFLASASLFCAGPAVPVAMAGEEEADTNGDGKVDEGEYQWYHRVKEEKRLAEERRRLDANNNGIVDNAEFGRSHNEKNTNIQGPKPAKPVERKALPAAAPEKSKSKKRNMFG